MSKNFRVLQILLSMWLVLAVAPALADESKTFLPTWRLLTAEQKQQFMAGYLMGLSDASEVTDIAIEYVQQNPKQAVESLSQLKRVYDMSLLSPREVAKEVDLFYADTNNKDKALTAAVSAARGKLR
jgi:hypothetical protein